MAWWLLWSPDLIEWHNLYETDKAIDEWKKIETETVAETNSLANEISEQTQKTMLFLSGQTYNKEINNTFTESKYQFTKENEYIENNADKTDTYGAMNQTYRYVRHNVDWARDQYYKLCGESASIDSPKIIFENLSRHLIWCLKDMWANKVFENWKWRELMMSSDRDFLYATVLFQSLVKGKMENTSKQDYVMWPITIASLISYSNVDIANTNQSEVQNTDTNTNTVTDDDMELNYKLVWSISENIAILDKKIKEKANEYFDMDIDSNKDFDLNDYKQINPDNYIPIKSDLEEWIKKIKSLKKIADKKEIEELNILEKSYTEVLDQVIHTMYGEKIKKQTEINKNACNAISQDADRIIKIIETNLDTEKAKDRLWWTMLESYLKDLHKSQLDLSDEKNYKVTVHDFETWNYVSQKYEWFVMHITNTIGNLKWNNYLESIESVRNEVNIKDRALVPYIYHQKDENWTITSVEVRYNILDEKWSIINYLNASQYFEGYKKILKSTIEGGEEVSNNLSEEKIRSNFVRSFVFLQKAIELDSGNLKYRKILINDFFDNYKNIKNLMPVLITKNDREQQNESITSWLDYFIENTSIILSKEPENRNMNRYYKKLLKLKKRYKHDVLNTNINSFDKVSDDVIDELYNSKFQNEIEAFLYDEWVGESTEAFKDWSLKTRDGLPKEAQNEIISTINSLNINKKDLEAFKMVLKTTRNTPDHILEQME